MRRKMKSVANEGIPSTVSLLRAMSDDNSLQLLKIIANHYDDVPKLGSSEYVNTQFLMSKAKLTRKQYYSRISNLASQGLIRKASGRYILTSFGKVADSIYSLVEQAIHDHWKLKAIDALETNSNPVILQGEREKIIDILIDNYRLKEILTGRSYDKELVSQHVYSSNGIKTAAKLSRMATLPMNKVKL
jgi:hypothetical protein